MLSYYFSWPHPEGLSTKSLWVWEWLVPGSELTDMCLPLRFLAMVGLEVRQSTEACHRSSHSRSGGVLTIHSYFPNSDIGHWMRDTEYSVFMLMSRPVEWGLWWQGQVRVIGTRAA